MLQNILEHFQVVMIKDSDLHYFTVIIRLYKNAS